MNEEDDVEFQHMVFVVLAGPPVQYYGGVCEACADDVLDVTRQEDFLAQVGFYGDNADKDASTLQVATHFTACTPGVFAQTQRETRCFVHVCENVPSVAAYRSQRKALRKERRAYRQKRLKYDDEKEASEEF